MAATPKKVLIVLLGAIGDVTRGLSLAMRIKRAWPDVELCWAVEPKSKDLVIGHPAIDKVFIFDRPRGLKAYISFLREIRSSRFDLVLDLQRHLKSGFTSFSTGAGDRIGFNPRNAKEFNWLFNKRYIPVFENFSAKIEHYQAFGDVLNLPRQEPLEFGLSSNEREFREIEQIILREAEEQNVVIEQGQKLAAFIVGSTWPSRFWLPGEYAKVAENLFSDYGILSLIVGGPSEKKFASETIAIISLFIVKSFGETSLYAFPYFVLIN